MDADRGVSLVELLIVMLVITSVAGISVPVAASVVDANRARQAAAFLSSRFMLARQQAIGSGANVGVVFDWDGSQWTVRVCRDGARNGLRRADIRSGADPCIEGPYSMRQLFPGVEIAVDPLLRGPGGEAGSPNPVRFGSADLVSFAASGSCTAGSVFLRSAGGAEYIVRVAGVTSRIRVMRYERAASAWSTP
jgi:prepilin-type N-terminal cleavage/methylation domain-containing protein